jgi:cysteine-rich repeat protein
VRLYVALSLLLCGCVKDDLIDCANGLVCPANSRCDDVHGSCATPDQFDACVGLVDGDACTANQLSGFCDQGVCIKPGCGNHVVEANEACDDGNHTSGDGCSADCTSNEHCGNGVLDSIAGEACDDGNLVSSDGCDSLCQVEPLVFDLTGIEPIHGNPGWSTYDGTRDQVVHYADGMLWAFANMQWQLVSTSGPTNFAWYQVVYDPIRKRVVVVGASNASVQEVTSTPIVIYEWDETTWTERTPLTKISVSPVLPGVAVYEPKTSMLLLVAVSMGNLTGYELADDWKPTPSQPQVTPGTSLTAAYDAARDVVVLASVTSAGTPNTLEWNTTTGLWAGGATTLPNGKSGFTLGYDGTRNKIVAIGGSPASTDVSTWDPMVKTWSAVGPAGDLPIGLIGPEVVSSVAALFDGFVFGGTDIANLDRDEVYLRNDAGGFATAKSLTPSTHTNVVYAYAYDDVGQRLVALREDGTNPKETWLWDGTTWSNADSSQLPTGMLPIVFDPNRGAMLATNASGTYQLNTNMWTRISGGITSFALTYDPDERELFSISGNVQTLSGSDTSWHAFASNTPMLDQPSLAFDARDHQLVLIDATGGATYVLDTSAVTPAWSPTVSPGPAGYRVVEDRRRGTVWFVSKDEPTWERTSGNWVMRAALPFAVDGPSVYAASGDMITIGDVGTSRVMLRRRFQNASPIETCVAGQDADGDGLADCDDPDCYAACGTCPPFATCN